MSGNKVPALPHGCRRVARPSVHMLVLAQGKVSGGARGRPKRWNAAEERALLVAFVRVIVGASPEIDKSQVPWGQFAGIHHSSCAAGRRISYYRLVTTEGVPQAPPGKRRRKEDLSKENLFYQLADAAGEVYRLRQKRREDAVRALLQRRLEELSELSGPNIHITNWSHALENETNPLLALVPERLRSVVPREELTAILTPENFSQLPPGRLFMAHDPEEERLHTQLKQMADAFYDVIPVTRPMGLSKRVREVEDNELLGRHAGGVRVHAPPRRLRGELRSAARGHSATVAGQAASMAAADGAGWRVAAAASALLAAVSASGRQAPGASAGEPAALLAAHAQARVAQAAKLLCTARVLHASRDAALLVALTRQALHGRDHAVDGAPPLPELRSAERLFASNSGAVDVGPRQRSWGGLMALVLTGTTSGHLNLTLSFSGDAPAAEADLEDLDQFMSGSTFTVNVHSSSPPDPPILHSGTLLSSPLPVSLDPHTALFAPGPHPNRIETSPLSVATSDTHRSAPAFVAVNAPAGLGRASPPGSHPGRRAADAPATDQVKRMLQAAVAAVALPLHAHLVAAGALPPAFVPPMSSVSDAACGAFSTCLTAVRGAVERAGAAGVVVAALLKSVVTGAAADAAWGLPPAEGAELLHAAREVGRTLALRDGSLAGTAMLGMGTAHWPAVADGSDASMHALACTGLQVRTVSCTCCCSLM